MIEGWRETLEKNQITSSSFKALNKTADGLTLIKNYYASYQVASLLNVLFEATLEESGAESAAKLARSSLIKQPSLKTLDQLLQAKALINQPDDIKLAPAQEVQDTQLMQQAIRHSIGNKLTYACHQCGFKARYHHWQCPACNAWEALTTEAIQA